MTVAEIKALLVEMRNTNKQQAAGEATKPGLRKQYAAAAAALDAALLEIICREHQDQAADAVQETAL